MMERKLILTHEARLREKFGADGWALLRAACERLAEADQRRGLNTRLVRIDQTPNPPESAGEPVRDPMDAAAVLRVARAVCADWQPTSLLLLGGPDVIPHQRRANPLAGCEGDPDPWVPSDLPYACAGDCGPEDLASSLPLGRLPDVPMPAGLPERCGNPDLLLIQLDHAARWKPRPADAYRLPFALGSRLWEPSTRATLADLFGSEAGLAISPPTLSGMHGERLRALSHYVNCHGTPGDDRIFGGLPGERLYLALESSELSGRLEPGVVVTSEGCYGAELFEPAAHHGRIPLALAYLRERAHAFWGSTSVSYGDAERVGPATRLCRLFHAHVLAGQSTGMAARMARATLAAEPNAVLDATTRKTLDQFLLLGDPSIRPVG